MTINPSEIIARIDEFTIAAEEQERRNYLGASEVGERCLRKLYYKFHWCGGERFDGRMLRLFERGDDEEIKFRQRLRGAGFIVRVPYNDYEDGESDFKFKDMSGHFAGTCDGAASEDGEEWFLLEFKTYKAKNFSDLKRCGVKDNDPKYWSQCQVYMGELGFEKALFCAVSKDSDELYFEWIPFDQVHFNSCLNKAETVINATSPPEKICNDPKSFTCRYCAFQRLCHENIPLTKSSQHCRNCLHAAPAAAGTWECRKGQTFGTLCSHYSSVV